MRWNEIESQEPYTVYTVSAVKATRSKRKEMLWGSKRGGAFKGLISCLEIYICLEFRVCVYIYSSIHTDTYVCIFIYIIFTLMLYVVTYFGETF